MKAARYSDVAGTAWSGSRMLAICSGVLSSRPQTTTTFLFEALRIGQDSFGWSDRSARADPKAADISAPHRSTSWQKRLVLGQTRAL